MDIGIAHLRLTGLLLTWRERCAQGERFTQESFPPGVLDGFFRRGAPLVWNDDPKHVIGRVTALWPDAVGLRLVAVVDTDDAGIREAVACRHRNCLSWIGAAAHWPLVEELTCVSVVRRGAHPSAVILTVEHFQEVSVCSPSRR